MTVNSSQKKNVTVDKEHFKKWWTEGNLDKFEEIKYLLVAWMAQQIKQKGRK